MSQPLYNLLVGWFLVDCSSGGLVSVPFSPVSALVREVVCCVMIYDNLELCQKEGVFWIEGTKAGTWSVRRGKMEMPVSH